METTNKKLDDLIIYVVNTSKHKNEINEFVTVDTYKVLSFDTDTIYVINQKTGVKINCTKETINKIFPVYGISENDALRQYIALADSHIDQLSKSVDKLNIDITDISKKRNSAINLLKSNIDKEPIK